MGVYLSSPVTEKDSIDEHCDGFTYGASSMQGWRITQEDAHNCIPVFDDKTKTSFFAVYDGHGGSEVAKYCERHFPDFVKRMMEAQGGTGDDPSEFIQNAFLAFDATLTSEDVIKELKVLAGKDDDNEEDEDDDPVGRSETDMLKEEADMPLDQLLAQYKSSTPEEIKNVRKQENFQSPALKAKSGGSTSDEGISSQDAENGPSSSSSISISSLSSPSSSSCQQDNVDSSTVTNGVKNSNNSNSTNQSQTQDDNDNNVTIDNGDQENRPSNNNNVVDKVTNTTNSNNLPATESNDAVSSSTSSSKKKKVKSHVSNSSNEATPGGSQSATSSNSCSSSSSTSQPGGSSSGTVSSTDSNDEPSGSGTGRHSGVRSSKAKAAVDMAMVDGAMDTSDDDDDDEEEEEDAWEDMSEDEDDDDDDDDDEGDHDEDVPMMDMTNEEPGSDSGCTACVVLMQGKKLIVANAGDSRCVLSRAGKAVELSFDHKPEDDTERERIENAGGKVTADGRVNGGLNLSRAIGDHVYKRNKDLPDREQMITALPDIETAELCDEDQFIVIACDGIWNYMSSQEVVNYVTEKLKDPERRQTPSIVCEELFDHCLAPNTFGDGTGCDNMTCIIIVLDTYRSSETQPDKQGAATTADARDNVDKEENSDQSSQSRSNEEDSGLVSGALKRCSDNVEVSEGKRLKMEEEVA